MNSFPFGIFDLFAAIVVADFLMLSETFACVYTLVCSAASRGCVTSRRTKHFVIQPLLARIGAYASAYLACTLSLSWPACLLSVRDSAARTATVVSSAKLPYSAVIAATQAQVGITSNSTNLPSGRNTCSPAAFRRSVALLNASVGELSGLGFA